MTSESPVMLFSKMAPKVLEHLGAIYSVDWPFAISPPSSAPELGQDRTSRAAAAGHGGTAASAGPDPT